MRGCFVTGTDTGAGKSVVAACLAAALRRTGVRVAAHKPVLTGTGESAPQDGVWPPDDRLLALAAGGRPTAVAPRRFAPAVSPHLAAELAGVRLDLDELVRCAGRAGAGADVLVVEGVGGLLVPLTGEHTVRDLARALGLPLVVAARPGLGTINHTLLTLEAARAADLEVRGVVLTPWPGRPGRLELSNRETIARLGAVEVSVLRRLARPGAEELAAAGAALPADAWLGAVGEPQLVTSDRDAL